MTYVVPMHDTPPRFLLTVPMLAGVGVVRRSDYGVSRVGTGMGVVARAPLRHRRGHEGARRSRRGRDSKGGVTRGTAALVGGRPEWGTMKSLLGVGAVKGPIIRIEVAVSDSQEGGGSKRWPRMRWWLATAEDEAAVNNSWGEEVGEEERYFFKIWRSIPSL